MIREMVRAIMAEKPLNKIIRQPTTATMHIMMEQLAIIAAAIKVTAWGGNMGPWHSSSTKTTTEPSQETCRQPSIGYKSH